MKRRNCLLWCPLLLGAASIGGEVQASSIGLDESPGSRTVLYSGSDLVEGSAANAVTLSLPGPGELFLTLTDLDFPDPFASLQFALSSTQTTVMALSVAGTTDIKVASPTTLYANVFAATQAGSDLGLYNLTATFVSAAEVALPASGGLLGSVALPAMALAFIYRRRARTIVTTAVA
jgi:hypothetical protein